VLLRSLGVPESRRNAILSLAEIGQSNERIEDENLGRIWSVIHREVTVAHPALQGVPAVNAPARDIRNWMRAEVNQPVLQGIRALDLGGLQLTCVPKEIRLFTGLQQLTLINNELSSLPEGIFQELANLQTLFLLGNRLITLPEGLFSGMTGLQALSLHNNRLITLPEGLFSRLTALNYLMFGQNPELMISLEPFLDGTLPQNRLAIRETIRTFFNYAPESPLAQLYQLSARSPLTAGTTTPVAVQRAFAQLPQLMRNAIFGCIWEEAGRPNTRDPQWGEHHVFDDMQIFCRALKRYVRATFENLEDSQRHNIYGQVYALALTEPPGTAGAPNFNVPNWSERRVRQHILLLIDLMSRQLR
jgi:Leucine-rich repeat (LRR) protein